MEVIMAFLQMLQEMLTRTQVADLATNVAVMSLERAEAGDPKRYLNVHLASKGKVVWERGDSSVIFAVKGKFLKDIYPLVKGQLGKSKFVPRETIRDEMGFGSGGAIQSDMPSGGQDRSRSIGIGGAE